MKLYKKLTAIALCVLVLMVLMPGMTKAAQLPASPLQLTISYQSSGNAVPGAPLSLYKVAALNTDLSLTADATFSGLKTPIEDPNVRWADLANTLEDHIARNMIAPDDTARTDTGGKAVFPSGSTPLDAGVYLILSKPYRYGGMIYDPSPMIVTLPGQDTAGNWISEVTAYAKFIPIEDKPVDITVEKIWKDKGHESKRPSRITMVLYKDGREENRITLSKEMHWRYVWNDLDPMHTWTVMEIPVSGYETKPPHTVPDSEGNKIIRITNTYVPSKPPKLPQTGQLNWPVPILLSCGGLLFILGCVLCFGRRKDDYA